MYVSYTESMNAVWSTVNVIAHKNKDKNKNKTEDTAIYEEFKSRNANDTEELLYLYENDLLEEKTDYMKRMWSIDENEKLAKEFELNSIEKKIRIIRGIQSHNIDYVTDIPLLTFRRILSAL
jgi:hypothetical protein